MNESPCPVVLTFGVAWAAISAIFVIASIAEERRKSAWFWAVAFAASSLAAAYCFRRLTWGATL